MPVSMVGSSTAYNNKKLRQADHAYNVMSFAPKKGRSTSHAMTMDNGMPMHHLSTIE